jgi:hypothetical protein
MDFTVLDERMAGGPDGGHAFVQLRWSEPSPNSGRSVRTRAHIALKKRKQMARHGQ